MFYFKYIEQRIPDFSGLNIRSYECRSIDQNLFPNASIISVDIIDAYECDAVDIYLKVYMDKAVISDCSRSYRSKDSGEDYDEIRKKILISLNKMTDSIFELDDIQFGM